MMRRKIPLIILASIVIVQLACSAQRIPVLTQVVTVVVTSVVEPATGTDTPTSQPSPSETPQPVSTPTQWVATEPSPTALVLLTARIEGDQNKIRGAIYWPDYGDPASIGLDFWVKVHNPEVGNKDGAGITSVDFVITDSSGQTVYHHLEKRPPYCAFGGTNQNCFFFTFADNGNTWPGTHIPIQNGHYSLTATVNAADGNQWSGTANFRIRLP